MPNTVRPAPPVAPELVPLDKIRIGTVVVNRSDLPFAVDDSVVVTTNEYLAWAQAKLSQGFRSVGFSDDEADQKAASAVLFGVIGGASAAIAAGVPVFLAVALFTVPLGATAGGVIGSFVPPTPFNTVPGIAIGAAGGAAAAAAVAALAALGAGTLGAAIGVGLGYALGGGDPNANPADPWAGLFQQWQDFLNPPTEAAPLPNPGGNQFELVFDSHTASAAGLPAVDYTVSAAGDVAVSATVLGQDINLGWSAQQAAAPYELLGPLKEPAQELVAATVADLGDALGQLVPDLSIAYPQTAPAA